MKWDQNLALWLEDKIYCNGCALALKMTKLIAMVGPRIANFIALVELKVTKLIALVALKMAHQERTQ